MGKQYRICGGTVHSYTEYYDNLRGKGDQSSSIFLMAPKKPEYWREPDQRPETRRGLLLPGALVTFHDGNMSPFFLRFSRYSWHSWFFL
jgi:hypothetical protein